MPRLKLLGKPRLLVEQEWRHLPVEKPLLLLFLLAFEGNWVERGRLAFLFYADSDETTARNNLRRLLARARDLPFTERLEIERQRVRWPVATDVTAFVDAVQALDWARAVELYQGRLLAEVDLSEMPALEQVLDGERERLHRLWWQASLKQAAALEDQGEIEAARHLLADLLVDDPINEEVVRDYMRLCYLTGDRGGALRAFADFERVLRDEYGGEPHKSTVVLAEGIRAGTAQVRGQEPGSPVSGNEVPAQAAPAPEAATEAEQSVAGAPRGWRWLVFAGGLAAALLLVFALDRWPFSGPGENAPDDRGPSAEVESKTAPRIAGCDVFPANNIWNVPVDQLPVHSDSAVFIETMGADESLRASFGAGLYEGVPVGIPYVVVSGEQPMVEVTFDYPEESDAGPYPIPPGVPIEGGAEADDPRRVIVLENDNCRLYELVIESVRADGSWHAIAGAIYNLNANALRPAGWTSADAAGLPVLPGLVRFDEVASGEIRHALRFNASQTRASYVWPARHDASELLEARYPPMGQRFRLRADVDISAFSPEVQVILTALKTYGMILAENGGPWFLFGTPDARWDNEHLRELQRIKGSDFEAVDVSELMTDDPHSGRTRY